MTVQTGRGKGEWGTMISLIIIVEAAEGKADLFAEYLTEEARDVLKHEPGCRAFVVSRSVENPQVFSISELYDDQAALDAHRLTPHFLLFQQRVQEHGLIANKTPVLGEVIVS